MELIKPAAPLEFQFQDVTLLIKPQASQGDRHEVIFSGHVEGGKSIQSLSRFNKTLARLMVVGWRGVTQDGKPAPYSWPMLESGIPIVGGEDLFSRLGEFILTKTDIMGGVETELKKASPTA